MARAIPETMPDELADLIYQGWGDMKSFAEACGLPYTKVYSVLVRSNHLALDRLISVATILGVEPEKVAKAFLQPTEDKRRASIQLLCRNAGISIIDVGDRSDMSSATIYRLISGELSGENYRTYLRITSTAKLSLRQFRMIYRVVAA